MVSLICGFNGPERTNEVTLVGFHLDGFATPLLIPVELMLSVLALFKEHVVVVADPHVLFGDEASDVGEVLLV